ncbi:EcsC family protein [Shouchella sp. JSM 1781072]|uniref:EcsC family protein n=1 Tax=Shouchella sp. JSM 1781072 TaxID=3344581 RepID=UPI0035BFBABE
MNVNSVEEELIIWKRKQLKPDSFLKKKVSHWQSTWNTKMPKVYHQIATQCVKITAEAIIYGINKNNQLLKKKVDSYTLEEADKKASDVFRFYRRMALAEGIGTGAGGFIAGAMDFPLLLSLKLKALFDSAHAYGFSTKTIHDRMFILLLFQFNYGDREERLKVLAQIEAYVQGEDIQQTDWEKFQLQYRDTIDLPKTLQLFPVVGAFFGGTANYYLLTKLEENTIQICRLRWLTEYKKALTIG